MTPINLVTNTAGTPIMVGTVPEVVAFTPNGAMAYVVNDASVDGVSTVTPITVATNTPGAPIRVGMEPIDVAITLSGNAAFVSGSGTNTVSVIHIPG